MTKPISIEAFKQLPEAYQDRLALELVERLMREQLDAGDACAPLAHTAGILAHRVHEARRLALLAGGTP